MADTLADPLAGRVAGPGRRRPWPMRQRGFMDFSFTELVITFGIALVVLGPKKLPALVQQIGRWVGRARMMAQQFRQQLESEVNTINNDLNVVQPVSKPANAGSGGAATASTTATGAPAAPAGGEAGAAPDPAGAPWAAPQDFHAGQPTRFTPGDTQPADTRPAVTFSNPLDEAGDEAVPVASTPAPTPAPAAAPAPTPTAAAVQAAPASPPEP